MPNTHMHTYTFAHFYYLSVQKNNERMNTNIFARFFFAFHNSENRFCWILLLTISNIFDFLRKKNVRQLLYDGCLLDISVCTKSKNERKKNWENCSFVVVEVIKSFALNGALWLHSLLNLPTKHAFAADLVCLLLLLSLFVFQSNIFFNLEFIAIAIYLVLR